MAKKRLVWYGELRGSRSQFSQAHSVYEDCALIGDCHTAGLVGRNGSIDRLCLPRFDSPACCAALLGTSEHGRWRLYPSGDVRRITRRYRDGTLILETDYETNQGAVTVVDCMPPRSRGPNLVRVVVGKRGQVRMQMHLVIRFDYGSIVPWVRRVDQGLWAVAGPDSLLLYADVPMHGENLTTVAEFVVSEGQRVPFTFRQFSPSVLSRRLDQHRLPPLSRVRTVRRGRTEAADVGG